MPGEMILLGLDLILFLKAKRLEGDSQNLQKKTWL